MSATSRIDGNTNSGPSCNQTTVSRTTTVRSSAATVTTVLDRRKATSQPPHFVGPLPDGHPRSVLTNDPATGLFAHLTATSPVKHCACPGFSPRRPHSAENPPDRLFTPFYEPKTPERMTTTRYARAGSMRARPPRVPPSLRSGFDQQLRYLVGILRLQSPTLYSSRDGGPFQANPRRCKRT